MVMTLAEPERHPIQCDCCGTEVVAVRVGDRIIIRQKRHGRIHVGTILVTDLLLSDLPAEGER